MTKDHSQPISDATEAKLTEAERRRMALDLRLAGMTYEQIADECGWKAKSSAKRAVDREIALVPRESAAQLKTMQLEILNQAKLSIFTSVRVGDVFSIDRLMKILDHEARLEGLYQLPEASASVEVKVAFADLLTRAQADAASTSDAEQ